MDLLSGLRRYRAYHAPDPSPYWVQLARVEYYQRRNDEEWIAMVERIRSTPSGEEFYYRVQDIGYHKTPQWFLGFEKKDAVSRSLLLAALR